MEAQEYIRKVKIIDSTESINKFSYGLSIDEVVKLMDGFAEVKNNVASFDVDQKSEQFICPECKEQKEKWINKCEDCTLKEFKQHAQECSP